jgi:ribosomal protein S18 acetylase RimI-like enzyme
VTDRPRAPQIEYWRLDAAELSRVHEIDRAEVIDGIYRMVDGALRLEEFHLEVSGWPPGEPDGSIGSMRGCLERDGAAWGAFDGERLIGIAVLDGRRIGSAVDTLDLYFLHVSNGYRGHGIGHALVDLVRSAALELGARRLYVSSSETRNTVEFYQRLGFRLAVEVDAELFEREPRDIHMDLEL